VSSEYELRQIARNDEDSNVRIAAIQKLNLNSEYELRQIARNDPNPQVREAAVRQL